MKCSGFTWMRCTLRRQTAGVAKATLRIVDDERTVQTREDGVLNKSVVPKLSETTDKLTSPARAAGEGKVLDPTLKCHGFDVVFADELHKAHIRTLGKGKTSGAIPWRTL